MKDYYKILGVSPNASNEDIRKAYKDLVKKYHPDVSRLPKKTSEKKFMDICEAYEVLIDERKRVEYDSLRENKDASEFFEQGFGWENFTRYEDLEEILGGDIYQFFFGRSQRYHPMKGKDVRLAVEISLEEAMKGATKTVRIKRNFECKRCHGSGAEPGTQVKHCPVCKGLGQIKGVAARGFNKYITADTCPRCHGRGKVVERECIECHGRGKIKREKETVVKIPLGVRTNTSIKIIGEGEEGKFGGPPGDLYIEIIVKEHENFRRIGNDLYCTERISFATAALGGEVMVNTLDGKKVKLIIPRGTQSGTILRLRNLGMPSMKTGKRGDLYVTVEIEVPTVLSSREKELLMELEGMQKAKEKHGIFQKILRWGR